MLEELLIRNIGVIDEVTLRLAAGLNVLTGETGAGKTMVVSALELLTGGRADADQVRAGTPAAVVEGRLRPPPPGCEDWLAGDDELVVSREISGRQDAGSGRSRARLGGRLAPASALAEVVGSVIELHGQSESVRLAAPAVQRDLLDRFGGRSIARLSAAYRDAFDSWRELREERDRLTADTRERARELDRLAFELDEIDAVAPAPGEDDALDAELRRLEHAEALLTAATAAGSALTDDGGARDALGFSVSALRAVDGYDDALDVLGKRAESLAVEAQDLAFELGRYVEELDLDPGRLESLRERRGALARLVRKYGHDAAGVVAYAEEARARHAELSGGDERAAALEFQVAEARAALTAAAEDLRAARVEAGGKLAAEVERHLGDLAMAAARVQIAVEPIDPAVHGADRVTFLLAPNTGEPALPLGKAASGGERSRVALAIRVALADADATPVLVFDEVDAGVGGATALAVGEKLADLARGRQVLCVTHLAQLAAFADAHFVVAKGANGDRTTASVCRLDEEEGLVELSRMLSGSPESALSAEHAAELRASAVATKKAAV